IAGRRARFRRIGARLFARRACLIEKTSASCGCGLRESCSPLAVFPCQALPYCNQGMNSPPPATPARRRTFEEFIQLAQRLVKNGVLNEADLPRVNDALKAAQGRPAHEVLIDRGFAKEDAVLSALAEEFGLDVVDLTVKTVPPEVLATIPQKLVHRRNLIPLSRDNGTLTVATGNPYDLSSLDEVQTVTGMHVVPVLASPREIFRLIKTYYGVGGDTVTAMVQERGEEAVEL